MKKNEYAIVEVTDLSEEGAGIGKTKDGYTLFIKGAVPGDQVECKVTADRKKYGFAIISKVLKASPVRMTPCCPVAGPCGGCTLQHLSYPGQLKVKEERVKNCLLRLGGISLEGVEWSPIQGMEHPWHYRNKSQYPVGRDMKGALTVGFYASRTHSLIPMEHCAIGEKMDGEIAKVVLQWMEKNKIAPYEEEKGEGLVRHLLIRYARATGERMVCLVVNGKKVPKEEELVEQLMEIPGMASVCLNENTKNTNVILGEKTRVLGGKGTIEDRIGGVSFHISPRSFYQVNPVQTGYLYGKVKEYAALTGKEILWDLYCGIGTIGLFLASEAKQVYGVEIVPEAIEDARENAKRNGLEEKATFFVGAAEEIVPQVMEKEGKGEKPDVIVVDPPRKGCEESLLECMAKAAPEKIIYVSCNPATLARDLKKLGELGYVVKKGQAVDQFPMTMHVESVVLLSRGESYQLPSTEES